MSIYATASHRLTARGREQCQAGADTEECLSQPVTPASKAIWHPLWFPARYRPSSHVTGYVHCALAFSTLLSSQGADAHHHKAFACFRGNPLTLPASPRAVKRFHQILTTFEACSVQPAYPSA